MTWLPLDRARWPLAALLASLAMLGAAHGFERFAHLAPCPLCYTQRQVYWGAAAIAVIGALLQRRGASSRMMFAVDSLLGVVFLAGAGVAAYHSGVELGIFPAPDTCAVGAADQTLSGDLWSQLNAPLAVPACAEPKWWFLGLTMASWNAIISLSLAALSLVCAWRGDRQADMAGMAVR
ncbi:disulfide bond formation protein B [bacterium]|nr:disulfide bond formation protein B [bacterium]